ncbi:MAG: glutamate racemase [Propionibacteriaceae bacterium]|nr:glutamate racemase [Propionibacteriaceae bacterium]
MSSDVVDAPIGIFDSGFGGLTVARAIVDVLPNEDVIYLGDTARAPYGPRPIHEVREYTLQCLDALTQRGVKAIVIACNTGSSAALRDARERYDVPIIDVIIPAAMRAAASSRNGLVGVACTQATATSRSYNDALAASEVSLTTSVCPRFVELVEQGVTTGPEVMELAEEYLANQKAAGVDTLILGCTHYPLLSGVIGHVMGERVSLVSSAAECARAAFATLVRAGLLREQPHRAELQFFTTGDPARFEGLGRRLMGGFVRGVCQLDVG